MCPDYLAIDYVMPCMHVSDTISPTYCIVYIIIKHFMNEHTSTHTYDINNACICMINDTNQINDSSFQLCNDYYDQCS